MERQVIPALTEDQMREVDRIMVDDLAIGLVQMMENAGRHLADLALRLFEPSRVIVLAGPGGNGGGGLVAARHLANRGADVAVVLSSREDAMTTVPAHQLDIVRRMGLPIRDEPGVADLVLDAVIGYSLRGDLRGRAAELIDWANGQEAPILSLDTPSGLDVTSGQPAHPCVRASATLTLALPKVGLFKAPDLVGSLHLADISVPSSTYERLGITVGPIFAKDTILDITGPAS